MWVPTLIQAKQYLSYLMKLNSWNPSPHSVAASRSFLKVDDVKDFTFSEMVVATNSFDRSSMVGEGGYGKVYRGILADGTVVAIKRAQEGSRQGEKEFCTEIELLSRLHHRNLVSLIGYCDDEGEQVSLFPHNQNSSSLVCIEFTYHPFFLQQGVGCSCWLCISWCRCWFMSSCPTARWETIYPVHCLVRFYALFCGVTESISCSDTRSCRQV